MAMRRSPVVVNESSPWLGLGGAILGASSSGFGSSYAVAAALGDDDDVVAKVLDVEHSVSNTAVEQLHEGLLQ